MNDSRDHLDEVVDCLRHRPVSTTALQMRQAADEIQRCWREHDEDMERMERATVAIELLSAEAERLQQRIAEMETEAFDHVRKIKAITATNALIDEGWKARDRRIAELGRQNKILELKTSGTPTGLEALGPYEPLPAGEALIEYWRSRLGVSGMRAIFDAVVAAYPKAINQEEVAGAVNLSSRSGTWSTYLSKLRGLGLIEGRKELRASGDLF